MANVRQPGRVGANSFSTCVTATAAACATANTVEAHTIFDASRLTGHINRLNPGPLRNIVIGAQRHRFNKPSCDCALCTTWVFGV